MGNPGDSKPANQTKSTETHNSTLSTQSETILNKLSGEAAINEFNIFYIFVGLSAIIILIFVFRALRFQTKKSTRIRRYGVVTARGDVEMMPLDNEDDDEDATVFDILDHSGPQP